MVYLRDADGSWRKVDTTEDGSYLVFTAMTDETTLAAVEKPGIPLPILIGGAPWQRCCWLSCPFWATNTAKSA